MAATIEMTAEVARYIARRTPRGKSEKALVREAFESLARAELSVRGVENEIARKLTDEEREHVESVIADACEVIGISGGHIIKTVGE